MSLVLASSSPRRRALLQGASLCFEVDASRVEERVAEPGEDPVSYALAMARQKAQDIEARRPGETVLAADTVVYLDGVSLGKPGTAEQALAMLMLLRGRSHQVVTGVVVLRDGLEQSGAVTARVMMRAFDGREAEAYVATGEPMDKAGAYAVQGLGGRLVERVDGCFNTVVGLPLCLTFTLLHAAGCRLAGVETDCEHRGEWTG